MLRSAFNHIGIYNFQFSWGTGTITYFSYFSFVLCLKGDRRRRLYNFSSETDLTEVLLCVWNDSSRNLSVNHIQTDERILLSIITLVINYSKRDAFVTLYSAVLVDTIRHLNEHKMILHYFIVVSCVAATLTLSACVCVNRF